MGRFGSLLKTKTLPSVIPLVLSVLAKGGATATRNLHFPCVFVDYRLLASQG